MTFIYSKKGEKMDLQNKTIAILIEDWYEEMEFWYPYYRMKEAGADVICWHRET